MLEVFDINDRRVFLGDNVLVATKNGQLRFGKVVDISVTPIGIDQPILVKIKYTGMSGYRCIYYNESSSIMKLSCENAEEELEVVYENLCDSCSSRMSTALEEAGLIEGE